MLIFVAHLDDTKCIAKFAKNFLPIFFNLYTSDDEACKGIALQVLDGIRSFLLITDQEVSIKMFKLTVK